MSLLPLASPAHPKVAFYWIPGWKSTNMLAGRTTLSQAITEKFRPQRNVSHYKKSLSGKYRIHLIFPDLSFD
jgi:hypothetical protein